MTHGLSKLGGSKLGGSLSSGPRYLPWVRREPPLARGHRCARQTAILSNGTDLNLASVPSVENTLQLTDFFEGLPGFRVGQQHMPLRRLSAASANIVAAFQACSSDSVDITAPGWWDGLGESRVAEVFTAELNGVLLLSGAAAVSRLDLVATSFVFMLRAVTLPGADRKRLDAELAVQLMVAGGAAEITIALLDRSIEQSASEYHITLLSLLMLKNLCVSDKKFGFRRVAAAGCVAATVRSLKARSSDQRVQLMGLEVLEAVGTSVECSRAILEGRGMRRLMSVLKGGISRGDKQLMLAALQALVNLSTAAPADELLAFGVGPAVIAALHSSPADQQIQRMGLTLSSTSASGNAMLSVAGAEPSSSLHFRPLSRSSSLRCGSKAAQTRSWLRLPSHCSYDS